MNKFLICLQHSLKSSTYSEKFRTLLELELKKDDGSAASRIISENTQFSPTTVWIFILLLANSTDLCNRIFLEELLLICSGSHFILIIVRFKYHTNRIFIIGSFIEILIETQALVRDDILNLLNKLNFKLQLCFSLFCTILI